MRGIRFSGGDDRVKHAWRQAGERAAQLLEMPAASVTNGPLLECNGNREVIADGCTGILEYSAQEIRIAARGLTLRFCGSGLSIGAMDCGCLTVCGDMHRIEFLQAAEGNGG